jgi:glycosyltransferase involved in cell wall biosynthesis
MADQPLISVIIPVYNCDRYLGEAIESILSQTYRPLEILIIDDGSTDKSAEIAKSFIPSVKYYYQPNSGSCSSPLNYGIKLSQGDFLAFLDSDDLWLKDKLMIQSQCFAENPHLDIVFGHVKQFISPELDSAIRQRFEIPKEIIQGIHRGTMLIKKQSFLSVGYFDSHWQRVEFIDWYIRAKSLNLEMMVIPDILFKRRIHQNNIGIIKKDRQSEYVQVIKQALNKKRENSWLNKNIKIPKI